ncbi:MAG: hypothetical protein JJU28_06825 [Cyclobacteriaceae bacterium]|nr:hypothetical protein [Cyclobacteriaceae bacterium]
MITKTVSGIIIGLLIGVHLLFAQDLKPASPSEFFGYEYGSKFTYHHDAIDYIKYLADFDKRIRVFDYGKTTEGRPLIYVLLGQEDVISDPESFRKSHLIKSGMHSESINQASQAVIWLSFNMHGNEASTMETSLGLLYHLASDPDQLDRLSRDLVVVVDPCLNPDGHSRYVNWHRMVSTRVPDPDPMTREHFEPWPYGRANHYLFDMNRDWAWQSQHESRLRMEAYHRWMPQVHIDFHEQGYNTHYFFGPGARPIHVLIENWQKDFQKQIAENIANRFDEKNWRYFTDERFDLLYPGYGDTYPGLNGAVGLTFEMAGNSRAGSAIITKTGDTLTLKNRIAMNHEAALMALEASAAGREQLNQSYTDYFRRSRNEKGAYVLSGNGANLTALKNILDLNKIQMYYATDEKNMEGYDYHRKEKVKFTLQAGDVVIPKGQVKSRILQALIEPTTLLEDSLTYDITAWSLPFAFNIPAYEITSVPSGLSAKPKTELALEVVKESIGWLIPMKGRSSLAFISSLHKNGIKADVSFKNFSYQNREFAPGTLLVTRAANAGRWEQVTADLHEILSLFQLQYYPVEAGFRFGGISIGSNYLEPLVKNRIGILFHPGKTSLNNLGEFWHFIEEELDYQVSLLELGTFPMRSLHGFNVLILPSGRYNDVFSEDEIEDLKNWVSDGGRLILVENALMSLADEKGFGYSFTKTDKEENPDYTPFDELDRKYISKTVQGAIIEAKADNQHPLAFGLPKTYYILKNNSIQLEHLKSSGMNVVYTSENPRIMAGFAGSEFRPRLSQNLSAGVINFGRGQVILFADNPLFRSFWEQGKILIGNALLMPGM